MSDVTLYGENVSSLPEWDEITFSVPDLPNATVIDTTDSDVEIYVYLNPNKQWSSNYSQSVWIKVFNAYDVTQNVVTWDSTDPYTYKITISQGTSSFRPWYIKIQATIPKWTKIKALLQKIVGSLKEIDEIGQGAEIYGKNSAGTGDCSLAKQTYKNPLAGQCYGRLYQADGSLTTATTTVQQNDLFVVTPSTGKIKVLKAGTYLVAAQAYAYNGFTAGDLFKMVVQKGSTNLIQFYALERMSGQYQIIFDTRCITLSANDELNIAVTNDAAARGKVVSSLPTSLEIIKVA